MDTSRLLSVLHILGQEFSDYWDTLIVLTTAYTQARDDPTVDHSEETRLAWHAFEIAVVASPTRNLVPSRLNIFKQIGADRFFGAGAETTVREALLDAASGPAAAVSRLEAFQNQLSDFKIEIFKAIEGLESMGVEASTLCEHEYEVGILIPRSTVDSQLKNVNMVLDEWNDILRFLLELAGSETRDVQLNQISTGSFEFFALVQDHWVAAALAIILERLAKFYKWVLDIQLARKQLEALGGPASEVEATKKHERERFDKEIESIKKELLAGSPANLDKGRKNELGNALVWVIRQIARHLDRGLTIEVSFPPLPPPEQLPEGEDEAKLAQKERLDFEERWVQLKAAGTAVRDLPQRENPILQLGPAEPAPKVGETDDDKAADQKPSATRRAVKKKAT